MAYANDADVAASRTAFRAEEKKYKIVHPTKTKGKRNRGKLPQLPDLGEAIDIQRISDDPRVTHSQCGDITIYGLRDHPGLTLLPAIVPPNVQQVLVREALLNIPNPPNRTNHNAVYPAGVAGLWEAAQRDAYLVKVHDDLTGCARESNGEAPRQATALPISEANTAQECNATPAEKADTGEPKVAHDAPAPPSQSSKVCTARGGSGPSNNPAAGTEPPGDAGIRFQTVWRDSCPAIADVAGDGTAEEDGERVSAKRLLRRLRWTTIGMQYNWSKRAYLERTLVSTFPSVLSDAVGRIMEAAGMAGENYRPEAGIVNYYGPGDAISGHLDDAEDALHKPIVSISLGCKAVFLMGGPTQETRPTAILLRSGDAIIMHGASRLCYHGVPVIFTMPEASDIPLELSRETCPAWFAPFAEYLAESRINMNVRQVTAD
eukprot:jgi/Mesvir1/5835/Mv00629-RA.1